MTRGRLIFVSNIPFFKRVAALTLYSSKAWNEDGVPAFFRTNFTMVLKPEPDLAELRNRIRHSASHVMADVVTKMFPDAKLAIGPPTDDGFYYDFLLSAPFKEADLGEIERRMRAVMARDLTLSNSGLSTHERTTMNSDEPRKH